MDHGTMNLYYEEEKTILHCLYCRKQWTGIRRLSVQRREGTQEPDMFREFEATTPLEGLFYHETVVCKNCLSRVSDLYILQDRDPMLRKAKNLKKDMENTYSHMLDKYVRQYLVALSVERLQELASRIPTSGEPRHKISDLKQRLISVVVNNFEESGLLRDWTEKAKLKLASLEEEKARLLQFSLYERLPETSEDGTGFYRSCQNVPQAAYDSVKESFDALRSPYKASALRDERESHRHRLVSHKMVPRLTKKYLADMDAFLQSKGLTADMLFSGGRSAL